MNTFLCLYRTKGDSRVLVVDGGGSKRVAILGDQITQLAVENNWAGIIVNGCLRDSAIIADMDIGVKALGTHPVKSLKMYPGEKGAVVNFGGVEFTPGHWVYADEVCFNTRVSRATTITHISIFSHANSHVILFGTGI